MARAASVFLLPPPQIRRAATRSDCRTLVATATAHRASTRHFLKNMGSIRVWLGINVLDLFFACHLQPSQDSVLGVRPGNLPAKML
jgi:hypothetical protein